MSFQINSDKEIIAGLKTTILGSDEVTIRSGPGNFETEIFRAQLDPITRLPRIGINRTGNRIDQIDIVTPGQGYTQQPTVNIAPPPAGGQQAFASAVINDGAVVGILVNDSGSGYITPPTVTISGGNGGGATAVAVLDTIDFELDVNGAIRTSTSIISDTARILNIDIDNVVTPDLVLKAPNLKTYSNNTGSVWLANTIVDENEYRYYGTNVYQTLNRGTTGVTPPIHTNGIVSNGDIELKHIGIRVDDPDAYKYGETPDGGEFPRSITPLLGDRSDKIATTEYVLNLATNDVGGRVYVSEQIGNDFNDGRSAVNPVKTIKRAAQIAWSTPGVKETLIVAGGNYIEDNPISLPPDCSIVGDNLRLVIMRPLNPKKHMVKFGDKNYVIGVTYRDYVDAADRSVHTWDYAMVFDDKQRITFDATTGGDFPLDLPIGHQIFGPQRFRSSFISNIGGDQLTAGQILIGSTSSAEAVALNVTFDETDPAEPDAFDEGQLDFKINAGSFSNQDVFKYGGIGSKFYVNNTSYLLGDIVWTPEYTYEVTIAGSSPASGAPIHNSGAVTIGTVELTYLRDTYRFTSADVSSTRAEGEVVFSANDGEDVALPIVRIDFTKQGTFTDGFGGNDDVGGIVFYTNQLLGFQNIHDYKEGDEIYISGLPTAAPDLSMLNGYQRIYKVLEDADGRSRRFVIPKKMPAAEGYPNVDDFEPGANAFVRSASKSVTLSLLNSPFEFTMATPVARRYQDACLQIRNNLDFIADEVVGRINEEFAKFYYSVYDVQVVNGGSETEFKIYLGTSTYVHTYVSGGTVTYGGNVYNISNFEWDNFSTGVATITCDLIATPPSEDDIVRLDNILITCSEGNKEYPSFSIPVSDDKCRRDIKHYLNAIIRDLEFGSNYNTIEAAKKYVLGTQIGLVDTEIVQTVRALEYARELAVYAMRKWRTGADGYGSTYVKQYTDLIPYIDPTVIDTDPLVETVSCANVASAIDTLAYLFVDVITNDASGRYLDAGYLIARNRDLIADEAYGLAIAQYPALGLDNIQERKCRRDINYVITALLRDLILGGNAGVVEAAEAYYSGTSLVGIPAGELDATVYAFQQVRDLAIAAMRNWSDGAGNAITTTSPIPQFTDSAIIADPASPDCADVAASITTLMGVFEDILDGTVASGGTTKTYGTLFATENIVTYPDSTAYDADGRIFTPKSSYDDYPIIEASPYTQNSSVISFLGGSGALIDGSRVKQPNCPKPGLEANGNATFPNQGKSMVASAFTIVSQGGKSVGYKIIEDGYVQLVSVFCIFCADGVLCESGGYASITNSATNFGIYALRATGYRREAYSFDMGYGTGENYTRATVVNMVATLTNRTEVTVNGLGRAPLEHYIFKIDGYDNENPEIEYFIDSIDPTSVTSSAPFTARFVLSDGTGTGPASFKDKATGQIISPPDLVDYHQSTYGTIPTFRLHRPSICNSSSHTWEFAGSGTDYNALPENGGVKVEANEQVSENYGRTYVSGTDELGDFKVGTFAKIENRTGNITFTGTVTISEVEFLKLKGGDVVVTGFDASNTLGGANASNTKLPTQKAVRDYITNNLGPYLNKPYSTNPIPRALVELTDSGKISEDQLPAVKPFTVYTVADEDERLAIEGALAGSIAIQQDTNASYILNNDVDSQFVSFDVDPTIQFTLGDIFTGEFRDDGATAGSGSRIQATEYRQGVIYSIVLDDPGSGYVTAPVITITGGNPQAGAVAAQASCTIAGGEVVTVTIELYNGYIGGKGYTTPPSVTFSAPPGSGTTAQATALIESRLYGDIVNSIKMQETDSILTSDTPPERIPVDRVVNTSASDPNNWVSLSTNTIAANDITSGVISTARLALNNAAANSFTFLRGDQSYALAVQSLKGAETRYFAALSVAGTNNSQTLEFPANGNFVIGHKLIERTGIPADTYISAVLTEGNTTTLTISNSLTATLPLGTVLEFNRGSSPVVFDASYTQGGFIDDVIIANGGTGYAPDTGGNGQFFDVALNAPSGIPGTGLKANIVVTGGVVTDIVVTSSGSGYTTDFTAVAPAVLGAGTGLSLACKLSTVQRNYANVSMDISRAGGEGSTISTDPYGTVGVARFKKAQFKIGVDGNGSIELKTGIGSGLNADFLDDRDGLFYQNASNMIQGVLPSARLSGSYDIDISGVADFAKVIDVDITAATTLQSPTLYNPGITVENKYNNANIAGETTGSLYSAWPEVGLQSSQPGGNSGRHIVMTLRPGGVSADTSYGGLKQIAFPDDNSIGSNMYIRGTGFGVTSWKNWHKVWTSGNDGVGSGLDADRLDGKQLSWVTNTVHLNSGTLFDRRLPTYLSTKQFDTRIEIREPLATSSNASLNGKSAYKILFDGVNLTDAEYGSIFIVGNTVGLYNNTGAQSLGELYIVSVVPTTNSDSSFVYTTVVGVLVTGTTLDTSVKVGQASSNAVTKYANWTDYSLTDYNTGVGATLEVVSGTANLKLGKRAAGNSSTSPGIYFSSSSSPAPNYNSAIVAGQGTNVDGSGNLNVIVGSTTAFTVNSNPVYHQGNTVFTDTIGQSTYNAQNALTLRNAVMRDATGSFQAHRITLTTYTDPQGNVIEGLIVGAASLNVKKSGDSMTGTLQILNSGSGATSNLYVDGTITGQEAVAFAKGLTVDIDTLVVSDTNDRVSINQATPSDGAALTIATEGLCIKGKNLAHEANSLRIGEEGSGAAQIRAYGPNATTNGSLTIRSSRSDGSNSFDLTFGTTGHLTPGTDASQNLGSSSNKWSILYTNTIQAKTSISINDYQTNGGATLLFTGATGGASADPSIGLYNYRLSNQVVGDGIFAIQPNIFSGGSAGPTSWDTSALAIRGKRVAINTTAFSGIDTSGASPVTRNYSLNVQGDFNINGFVFQNNEPFVTSRWTEATNGLDIYRLSKVGINKANPTYTLHVSGNMNIEGTTMTSQAVEETMFINGDRQWLDPYGVMKTNRKAINQSITIPSTSNTMSAGPITINSGVIITIDNGGVWTIV